MSTTEISSDSKVLAGALSYARQGWMVLPLHTPMDAACSCGRPDCGSVGKHPRTPHGLKDASTDPDTIAAWWQKWPEANVGICTGSGSFVVLDVDAGHGGEDSLGDLEMKHRGRPDTVEAITGGGGRHILFAHPGFPVRNKVAVAPGLDIRGDGGYIVAPPSMHASGRTYKWELSSRPGEVDLAPIPDWLIKMLRAPTTGPGTRSADGGPIPDKHRNATLTSLAGSMRRRGMEPEEMEAALLVVNSRRCRPPLSPHDIRLIARSVGGYDPEPGANLAPGPGAYFDDRTFIPLRLARAIAEGRHLACGFDLERGTRQLMQYRHGVWQYAIGLDALGQEMLGERTRPNRVESALWTLERDVPQHTWSDWNRKRRLLNCQSGMLNPITMEMKPHDPAYLSTMQIPVEFDPTAPCPRVDQFLEEVLPADCIELACMMLGYLLIPDLTCDKFFVLHGETNTGKTTFLEAVIGGKDVPGIIGQDNWAQVQLQALADDKFAAARLENRLLGCFDDLDSLPLKSSATPKALTGGFGWLDVERKGQDGYKAPLYAKLLFTCNELPRCSDKSNAWYRRMCILPFTRSFEGDAKDEELGAKLATPEARKHLFALAVGGLHMLAVEHRWRFPEPESTRAELADYQQANDPVAAFVEECCTVGPHYHTERTLWYEKYREWCEAQGLHAACRRVAFGRLRQVANCRDSQGHTGERHFVGVGIKS